MQMSRPARKPDSEHPSNALSWFVDAGCTKVEKVYRFFPKISICKQDLRVPSLHPESSTAQPLTSEAPGQKART